MKKQALVSGILVIGLLLAGCGLLSSQDVLAPGAIKEINGRDGSTLIVTNDGELWVTGVNDRGQLGIYETDQRLKKSDGTLYLAQPIKLTDGVVQVVCLSRSSAYLTTSGDLWAMGDSSQMSMFPAAREKAENRPPDNPRWFMPRTKVLSGVQKIAAGSGHLLVLMTNGDLYGGGDGDRGQLGTEEMSDDLLLIAQDVTDVFAGDLSTFFLKEGGQLYACGWNYWGQLGIGENEVQLGWGPMGRGIFSPQLVTDNVKSVGIVDGNLTAVLKHDGRLYGTGENINGVFGTGKEYSNELALITDQVKKAVTCDSLLCLKTDAKLLSWGTQPGAKGQEPVPQWLEVLPDVEDFWVANGVFVLTKDGIMHAFGDDELGSLGGWGN